FARKDAETMRQSWLRQKTKLYQDIDLVLLADEEATRKRVLAELTKLAERVQPDDRVFLFLSGHGDLPETGEKASFVFCCSDFDQKQATRTGLTSQDLTEAMAAIPCRKIVLL